MATVRRFEELIAWQKARALVSEIYKVSTGGVFGRDFMLRDQIRSAALSVSSNIAEGFERSRLREFHQFLSVAKASCGEVRRDLYTAFDVGYVDHDALGRLLAQAEETGRVIGGLRRSVAEELRKATELRTQHSGLRTRQTHVSRKS